jgi:DNA-binding FadR family transcriptional regulator
MIRMLGPLLDAMEATAGVVGAGPESLHEHERILAAVRRRQGTAAANATARYLATVAGRHESRRPAARRPMTSRGPDETS